MKYAACSALFAAVVIVLLHVVGGATSRELAVTASARGAEEASEKPAAKAGKPSGPPPLVVDRDAPLLLDAIPKKLPSRPAKGPVADNSSCFVCHTNYESEEMVVVHAPEDVGCIKCHGKSYAHRDDEDNITPPDIMYPQDTIDKACGECHDTHDAPATKVVTRWQERCPDKEDLNQVFCTDCHGEHRLKLRTVRWDKATGDLIVRSESGIKPTPDYTKNRSGQPSPQEGFEEMR